MPILSITIFNLGDVFLKLYQFAHYENSRSARISELIHIEFLPDDYAQYTDSALFTYCLEKLFPAQASPQTRLEAMDRLLLNDHLTLGQFYQSKHKTLELTDFYNLVLQLLGFEVTVDFQLNTGATFIQSLALPLLKDIELIASKNTVIDACYYLLTLRCKNGLSYLDTLANHGYFNDFMKSKAPQFIIFNGRLQATFDATQTIREVVYVKSDLDTDQDGRPDLLETTIFRPKATDFGLKTPALYTANPYFKGTNDMTASLHNVDQSIAKKPVQTLSYQDLKRQTLADPCDQQQPTPDLTNGETEVAELTSAEDNIYSLNDYFLARGLATVYAGGIGTRHSDGLRTCGSPAETYSTTAIIEWLHGDRIAYTNKTDKIAIKAWWCNGNVAMTGKSYLGTLAIAAATTGVPGLKTIISESAISSWYDYYRDNGLVVAPENCQGEDADVLAIDTFSRLKDAADYQKVKPIFDHELEKLRAGQDRQTGNYNAFWDDRNYRNQVQNIKCPVLIVHGLNDWNVKLRNPGKLWAALKDTKLSAKVFLHQGQHVYMNNIRSIDFNDMANLWLTDKLLNYPNHSDHILPKVLIQDNAEAETWHQYTDWGSDENPVKRYALAPNKLLSRPQSENAVTSFIDNGTAIFTKQHLTAQQWTQQLLQDHSTFEKNRLQFKTQALTQSLYIDGNITVTAQLASSTDHGLLSVMVVDYGMARRLGAMPAIVERDGLKLGYNWHTEDLKEFQLTQPTPFKMITKGHINLQNRQNNYSTQAVEPNHFYTVHFDLQPTHYHLLKGHQLGLLFYATDMGMTLRSSEQITYQVDLNACQLAVPYIR